MADSVNPFDLLKEEMESDEIAVRINAIHRMKIIATLLGPDGIKNKLLPYLDGLIKKEEDEVLFAIAEELGNLGPFLPQNQVSLLPYLENLAGVEETVVRDMAVRSLGNLSSTLADYDILNNFIPMILKLANTENNFTCRVSAISLICKIYPRAGTQKEKLRQKFQELCQEETPMVRRALASKIGELANVVEKDFVIGELITNFKALAGDDMDQVRVLCLDSLKTLAHLLNKDENKAHSLPVIIQATEDKSWRVRFALANNFSELAESFGKEITDMSLIQIFTTLMRDVENEVKIVAIRSLIKFVKLIAVEKLSVLIPHIQSLAKDSNAEVRSGIAEVITEIIPQIGKEAAVQKLLTNILEMFPDENTEVRICVMKAATRYVKAVGIESITTMAPHFKNTIADPKWRVRTETLEGIADIAVHFSNIDMFTKHLEPLFFTYLKDKTYAVRDVGVKKLKGLCQAFKSDWCSNTLIPKLIEANGKDNNYLMRVTALYSLSAVASAMNQEFNSNNVLPLLVKAVKDPVPNVKFVLSQIFKNTINSFLDKDKPQLKASLTELSNDADKDVSYFAQEAIALLK